MWWTLSLWGQCSEGASGGRDEIDDNIIMKSFDWPAGKTSCGDDFVWLRWDHSVAHVEPGFIIAEYTPPSILPTTNFSVCSSSRGRRVVEDVITIVMMCQTIQFARLVIS